MEFILTFLLIFVGIFWIFGRVFPRILAWYIQRRIKKMGGNGGSFGSFGNNGFWGVTGFGGANFDADAERMAKEQEIKRQKEQEGNITILQTQEQEKVIEKNMGEYVDFEEDNRDKGV